MVLIHDRILKIDIYNFEMSQITPEKSLKSNQIYSVVGAFSVISDYEPLDGAFWSTSGYQLSAAAGRSADN